MKELMIHVERIVRPVRAFESRKLRMRGELLGHLQLAFEEERDQGSSEAEAFTRATQRLGEPAELTRSLQWAVPLIDRIFLRRISALRVLDIPVQKIERAFGSVNGVVFIVIAICFSFFFSGLWRVPMVGMSNEVPAWTRAMVAVVWHTQYGIIPICFALAVAAAGISNAAHWRKRVLGIAAVVVGLDIALILFIQSFFSDEWDCFMSDIIRNLVNSLLLGAILVFCARWLASLRRPNDEWEMLELNS
jgi:hypothetical protein